ncbi:hypothetical protein [Actinoallomurus soli]|uniref:hypothetical protein n=1 Tax=Actinoallomurus soli TaxID=2952535 RepID=UPI002092679A|nr:hypothetical protein [Actinoallomurus soli]MCO5973877.1 hypothetical protein [Actinoallomurus soli]
MRARDPAAVARTAVGTDAAASAQSLVRNYAHRLNGSVTVTFDEEKDNRGRTACLNYPAYPYQLYLFVVKGNNGKDSTHWKVSLGNAQGPPPPIPPGHPTPGPSHDKDSFCQDGFDVDQPLG